MTPFEAAVQYHVNCELYDQRICTGLGIDGAVPTNSWEYGHIQKNAAAELVKAAREARLSVTEMQKIISREDVIKESIRRLRDYPKNKPVKEIKI